MTERTIEQRLSAIEAALGIAAPDEKPAQEPPTFAEACGLLGQVARIEFANGSDPLCAVVTGVDRDFNASTYGEQERVFLGGIGYDLEELAAITPTGAEPTGRLWGISKHADYENMALGGSVAPAREAVVHIEPQAAIRALCGYVRYRLASGDERTSSVVHGVHVDDRGVISFATNSGSVVADGRIAELEIIEG